LAVRWEPGLLGAAAGAVALVVLSSARSGR